MSFGTALKELINQLNDAHRDYRVPIKSLAEEIGVSPSYISQLISGTRNPSLINMKALGEKIENHARNLVRLGVNQNTIKKLLGATNYLESVFCSNEILFYMATHLLLYLCSIFSLIISKLRQIDMLDSKERRKYSEAKTCFTNILNKKLLPILITLESPDKDFDKYYDQKRDLGLFTIILSDILAILEQASLKDQLIVIEKYFSLNKISIISHEQSLDIPIKDKEIKNAIKFLELIP